MKVEAERPLPAKKITIKMNNVDVAVLLRALAKAADQNIMINEKVKGITDINIKEAPWDQVFRSILRTHGLTCAWEGDIIRIMTAEDMEQDLKREAQKRGLQLAAPLVTRIIPVDYADAGKLQENLEKFLANNKEGKPIGSIMVDEHTNSLIIQAIREDIIKMIPIIEELDRPTPQVLIEAHIVEANQSTARELGVKWGGQYRQRDFVPASVALDPGTGTVVDVVDPATGLILGTVNSDTGDTIDLDADIVTGLLTAGFLGERLDLNLQLSALESEGKLNILSNPSITTIDNQKAVIESGKEVPYQTVEDDDVKIEFKKAVLSLEVTPHVIDGKTLKMRINTKKDELDFASAVGGQPAITTKKAETSVILRDGQTTVIGGLSKEKTDDQDYGTPVLRHLPLLGSFFKGKNRSNEMDELLIFITPHILKEHLADEAGCEPIEKVAPSESSSGLETVPPS
jgi:type IV pilus assembly protein PilQ